MPPGEVVDDSHGSHSLLITALLNEMNLSTVSVEKIFDNTRLTVTRKTQNQQVPLYHSSPIDDVSLGQHDKRSCIIRPYKFSIAEADDPALCPNLAPDRSARNAPAGGHDAVGSG